MILFSSPTCFACKKAKQFLNENKIEFEEANVLLDEWKKQVAEYSITTLPTLVKNDGSKIVGYSPRDYKDLIN